MSVPLPAHLALLALLATSAAAQPVVGLIERLHGDVAVDGRPAALRTPVRPGSTLRATGGAWALVELAERARVFVPGGRGTGSIVRFRAADASGIRVRLESGALVFRVPAGRPAWSTLRVETALSISTVIEGSGLVAIEGVADRVAVESGAADVAQASGATRVVAAGTMAVCPGDGPIATMALPGMPWLVGTLGMPAEGGLGRALLEHGLARRPPPPPPVETPSRTIVEALARRWYLVAALFLVPLWRWLRAARPAQAIAGPECPFCRKRTKAGVRTLRTPEEAAVRVFDLVGRVGAGVLLKEIAACKTLAPTARLDPTNVTLEWSWCQACHVGKLVAVLRSGERAPQARSTEVRGAELGARLQSV